MMTKKELEERRGQLVDRVNQLVEQIPALQREETACRGQVQLISELLGETPPPPGATEEAEGKPNGKPRRKGKALSRG